MAFYCPHPHHPLSEQAAAGTCKPKAGSPDAGRQAGHQVSDPSSPHQGARLQPEEGAQFQHTNLAAEQVSQELAG